METVPNRGEATFLQRARPVSLFPTTMESSGRRPLADIVSQNGPGSNAPFVPVATAHDVWGDREHVEGDFLEMGTLDRDATAAGSPSRPLAETIRRGENDRSVTSGSCGDEPRSKPPSVIGMMTAEYWNPSPTGCARMGLHQSRGANEELSRSCSKSSRSRSESSSGTRIESSAYRFPRSFAFFGNPLPLRRNLLPL